MRFTRQQHLRTAADFHQIRASGTRRECGFFSVQFLVLPGRVPPLRRLGVIASRRVGDAVRRNRAKRLLRELFRHNQDALPAACDLLLVARPAILAAPREDLERRFLAAVKKLAEATS